MSKTTYYAGTVGELRAILNGVPDEVRVVRRFVGDNEPQMSDLLAPVTVELKWAGKPSDAHLVRIGGDCDK